MINNRKFFYEIPVSVKLKDLADFCVSKYLGDADFEICGVNTLKNATKSQLSFLGNKKYMEDLRNTQAGVVIVNSQHIDTVPNGVNVIIADNVMAVYAIALEKLYEGVKTTHIVSNTSIIGKNVTLGDNVSIGDYVVIEDGVSIGDNCIIDSFTKICKNCSIGDNCKIGSHVSIKCAQLGNNVTIHSGAKIGEPGFGIIPNGNSMVQIKQLGMVVIGNNVRIGANTTIDRGAIDNTIIGDNTIIDNLVQIGHNVEIGNMVTIVSQVGIAGSSKIGDGAVLAGQVGIAGHVSIGKRVVIAAKSGVASDIEDGQIVGGIPAVDVKTWRRQAAFLKRSVER